MAIFKLPNSQSSNPNCKDSLSFWGGSQSYQGLSYNPTNIKQISSFTHNLILQNDGTVYAFGDNSDGQCNVPNNLNNVIKVAAGQYFSLALKNDGTVVGWGRNSNNQIDIPNISNIIEIAAGNNHGLALASDGTLYGWGSNFFNQISIPSNLSNIASIAAGTDISIILLSDGTVTQFGKFDFPSPPNGLTDVIAISIKHKHVIALKKDGSVVMWGDNTYNQLNNSLGPGTVKAIAAGYNFSVVLLNTYDIQGFGTPYTQKTIHYASLIEAGFDQTAAIYCSIAPTPTPTRTPSTTKTQTATRTPTKSNSASATPSISITASPTKSPLTTPSPTPSVSQTHTRKPKPTPFTTKSLGKKLNVPVFDDQVQKFLLTATPSPTRSATPSTSFSATPTISNTPTHTAIAATPTPSISNSPTISNSVSLSPSVSLSITQSKTRTTPTPSVSLTPSNSLPTQTQSPSNTPQPSPTPSTSSNLKLFTGFLDGKKYRYLAVVEWSNCASSDSTLATDSLVIDGVSYSSVKWLFSTTNNPSKLINGHYIWYADGSGSARVVDANGIFANKLNNFSTVDEVQNNILQNIASHNITNGNAYEIDSDFEVLSCGPNLTNNGLCCPQTTDKIPAYLLGNSWSNVPVTPTPQVSPSRSPSQTQSLSMTQIKVSSNKPKISSSPTPYYNKNGGGGGGGAGAGGGGGKGGSNSSLKNCVEFTSNGTFVVPPRVIGGNISITVIGAGGGGGFYNGGGGGGGGVSVQDIVANQGDSFQITVGTGGMGATRNDILNGGSANGADGGYSSFGNNLVVAGGGHGGHSGTFTITINGVATTFNGDGLGGKGGVGNLQNGSDGGNSTAVTEPYNTGNLFSSGGQNNANGNHAQGSNNGNGGGGGSGSTDAASGNDGVIYVCYDQSPAPTPCPSPSTSGVLPVYDYHISGINQNINVYNYCKGRKDSNGNTWNGSPAKVNFTIDAGAQIISSDTSQYALIVNNFDWNKGLKLTIKNYGTIAGAAGTGGTSGSNGNNGGTAISATCQFILLNNGYIFGGAGGGGGGASTVCSFSISSTWSAGKDPYTCSGTTTADGCWGSPEGWWVSGSGLTGIYYGNKCGTLDCTTNNANANGYQPNLCPTGSSFVSNSFGRSRSGQCYCQTHNTALDCTSNCSEALSGGVGGVGYGGYKGALNTDISGKKGSTANNCTGVYSGDGGNGGYYSNTENGNGKSGTASNNAKKGVGSGGSPGKWIDGYSNIGNPNTYSSTGVIYNPNRYS